MMLLLKLILAHLIGDFILQPDSWVKEKEEKKLRTPKLYIHALLHGALTLLIVWDLTFWLPAAIIAVSHLIIDAAKLLLQKEENKRTWFLVDQLLHLAVIATVWYCWQIPSLTLGSLITDKSLIYLTAVIALTFPAPVIIKILISKWTPHTEDDQDESLENAGKYIGILERLFVFAFVIVGQWQPVGFLLAAKSVFRFGDLTRAKDRKLTEYIMIGTLLSFGIAMLTAIAVRYVLKTLGQ